MACDMKTLHMMVGLPRSGKSTVARKLGYPIVCPDAIRQALHGTPFRPQAEPMVWGVADTMVRALFEAGHSDVTLDACNCTFRMRGQWLSQLWAVRYYLLDVSAAICKRRAARNGQDHLLAVIDRMAAGFEPLYAMAGDTRLVRIGRSKVKVS